MPATDTLLTEKEFVAFLLIYGSYADYNILDIELEEVKRQVGEEIFQRMYLKFDSLGEYQAFDLILRHKSIYFEPKKKKDQMLKLLTRQFKMDGDYSMLEKSTLSFLERLI